MADKTETISLKDISFDEGGRAVISKADTVARLKASATISAAGLSDEIKNIGCCSVTDEFATRLPELARVAADTLKTVSANNSAGLSGKAIKNIGCCSIE